VIIRPAKADETEAIAAVFTAARLTLTFLTQFHSRPMITAASSAA
jgi:hypothetical protein